MAQNNFYGTGFFGAPYCAQYRTNNTNNTGNIQPNSAGLPTTLLPGADVVFAFEDPSAPRKQRRKELHIPLRPWERVLDLSVDADTAGNTANLAPGAGAPTSGTQGISHGLGSSGANSEPWMQFASSFFASTTTSTPQTCPTTSVLLRHRYQTPSRSMEAQARFSELSARLEPGVARLSQASFDISYSGSQASSFESPNYADMSMFYPPHSIPTIPAKRSAAYPSSSQNRSLDSPLGGLPSLLASQASLQETPQTPAQLLDTPALTPDLMELDDHSFKDPSHSMAYSTPPDATIESPSSPPRETFFYEPWSRPQGTKSVYHAEQVVRLLRELKLSAINFFLILLDQSNTQFMQIQNALHRKDSNALERILYAFRVHPHINERFEPWLDRHGVDRVCDLVAKEVMDTSKGLQLPVPELTKEKLMGWSMGGLKVDSNEGEECILDEMPTWSKILNVAVGDSQTKARAERTEKRDTTVGKSVITHMIQNMRSQKSTMFTNPCGIALYAYRVPRCVINALNHIGFCCSYDTAIQAIEVLANEEVKKAKDLVLNRPFGIGYDNFNRSISVHAEQRGAEFTPAKTTAGTVSVVYALVNADLKHMELEPMRQRLLKAPSLTICDLTPSHEQITNLRHQYRVHIFNVLAEYTEGFQKLKVSPSLRFTPRKPKVPKQKSEFYSLRTSTIDESTVEGNIMVMEDIFGNQIRLTDEQIERISKYAIALLVDQLTTSQLRTGQSKRPGDINAFYTLICFIIIFGPFHLVLNLVWCLLKVHRHRFTQVGSLAYFFNVLDKKQLKTEHPDFKTLLNALMQILDGALIAAWELELRERNLRTPEEFAESDQLTPELIQKISTDILRKYATPTTDPS